MNSSPIVTVIVAGLSLSALADVEITREEAGTIPSVDLQKLKEKPFDYEGKIVKLKFNYRSEAVEKQSDGSLSGMIYISQSNIYSTRTEKSGTARVTVPAEGVTWYMKQPTNESRGSLVVVARVKKAEGIYPMVELLGREIRTDTKGSKIIW